MDHDHTNGTGKHLLLMFICCLVPLALIFAIGVFGFSLGSLSSLLPYAMVLLCPLMMIFMMRGMTQDHGANPSPHHVDAPRIAGNPKGAAETATHSREHLH